MKARIIIETTPEIKKELQRLAKSEALSLKDFLVLKGLGKLRSKGNE